MKVVSRLGSNRRTTIDLSQRQRRAQLRSKRVVGFGIWCLFVAMSYSGRPLPSHLRHPSTSNPQSSSGQSPVLLARINEKKAELANLKELQALSAGLADQMQTLEEKLATLSDGTEGKAINTAKPRVNTGTMLTPTGYSDSGGTIKLA